MFMIMHVEYSQLNHAVLTDLKSDLAILQTDHKITQKNRSWIPQEQSVY